jgi:hypothetical protein
MLNQIKILKPFFARYTLLVESDMKAVNVVMTSKVQIRWDFRVVAVEENFVEIELLMLDNILLESNNPLIKEIAGISQIFGRMYNELHLITDHKGKILKVLNMGLIKSKWAQTKTDMQAIAENNAELKSVISLNDALFTNEEKLRAGIQGSEFFMVYFSEVYSNKLPFARNDIEKNNFFNTIKMPWDYNVQIQNNKQLENAGPTVIAEVIATPANKLKSDFYQQAYAQFAGQIDITTLHTNMSEVGTYIIEKETGKLLEALLQRNEIADTQKLFTKMTYTLLADNNTSQLKNEIKILEDSKPADKKKRFAFMN